MFDESDVHDTPTGAANKESQTFFARLKRIGGSKSVKYQPVELNARKSKKQPQSSLHRVSFGSWVPYFIRRTKKDIPGYLSLNNMSFLPLFIR